MKAIYQLKIEINGSQPPIWRRIQVVNNVTFSELHDLIQITFGWNAEHEYEFVVNKTRIYDFGEKIDTGDNPGERDSMDTVLEEYLNMVNTRFTYTYDFEDRWKHTVIFEKVLVGDDSNVGYCTCIVGERACPPEDCGGIRSYQNMLNVLEDKGHPQHESTKELLGEDWDSRSFDIKNTNDFLRQYAEEWEEIFNETGEIIEQMEESENSVEDWDDIESDLSEYESLYPDVDTPICLRRGTWREEMEGKEERFYYDDAPFDEFDFPSGYYSSQKSPGFFGLPDKPGTIIKEKMPGCNDPCPCGSGKKYKKCCLDKDMD